MKIGKVEYRVRLVTRYVVTRYHENEGGHTGGSETKGEYENADMAYEVAYALASDEHRRLEWPVGDMRMQYPRHPNTFCVNMTSEFPEHRFTSVSTAQPSSEAQ